MRVYEFKREKRIEEIQELLKDMKLKGEVIDNKKLVIAIMNRYNIARRTAGEYLGVAMFKNELN